MSNGRKPVTPQSIYYNPFAEDRVRSTAIDIPGLLSDNILRPAVRRKASGSDSIAESSASSSSGISVFTSPPGHMRIRTDGSTDIVESGGHHPLRSADLSAGFRAGAGETRPQLTRILNIAPLVDAPPVPGADMIVAEPEEDEKVVLVHEVTSQDSLPGVSLKYGISLAELRRANHLWASDPIHLRKVLYIPLDKTSRAKDRVPSAVLVSTATEDDGQQATLSPTGADTSTIRRIPRSKLSFFPPPSRPPPQELPLPPSPPAQQPIPRTKHPHSRHARYATSPATTPVISSSPSFTSSILSALPIQPSTRDTLIARLSYDSTGTGTSSAYGSDSEEGHEMDDVRRGTSLDSSALPSVELATPRPKDKATPKPAHARSQSGSALYGGGGGGSGGAQYHRAGPPRTVQPEPSPAMQLPLGFGTIRRKGKSARANGDGYGDFDLLGLHGDGQGEGETVDDT